MTDAHSQALSPIGQFDRLFVLHNACCLEQSDTFQERVEAITGFLGKFRNGDRETLRDFIFAMQDKRWVEPEAIIQRLTAVASIAGFAPAASEQGRPG